nr:DUF6706 family protein [uncultured Porphyromonas sp.]
MTILEYILEKYKAMGVALSESYVQTLLVGKVNMHEDVYTYGGARAHRIFVESLPEFLLMPSSVSELGVSISRSSREAVEKYYRMECRRLGITDALTERPIIRFR